ncbi:MAG: DUF2974 domain-containing protein [Ruminococcus sp.]|nr:DUF2974 domain-containing protein [Ruminococcus sp.]
MDNMIDYLRWMGRFTFDEFHFSEVDALCLCQAAYYDLALSENYPDLPLTLSGHYDRVVAERHVGVNVAGTFACQMTAEFIKLLAKSRRFSELKVIDYSEKLDKEKSIQFCAVTFLKEGDFSFIAFRGTDDTLTGWKEDFMICFERTAAQKMALEYTAEHIRDGVKNYIGGHSKGANMALYSSCLLDYDLWNKVERVFLLDGPGICPEVMSTAEIARVNRRATSIQPQFCIIGKLFEPQITNTIIVDSSQEGFMQHDPFSWGIKYGRLKRVSDHSPESEEIGSIINGWIADITPEERRIFVTELFDSLDSNGCKTVEDFSKIGVEGFENILTGMLGASDATKKAVVSLPTHFLFGRAFKDIGTMGFFNWVKQNVVAKSIILIAIGIFFIVAKDNLLATSAKFVFTGLTLIEIVFTLRQLYKNNWEFFRLRYRMYLCISMIIICLVVLLRDQAVYILGSVLFGVIALIFTFVSLDAAINDKEDNLWKRIIHILEALISSGYGISFLLIRSDRIFRYIWGVGIAMIIDGILRIVIAYVPLFSRKGKPKRTRRH